MKRIIFATTLISVFSIISFGQTRQPSTAIRPFVVMEKQKLGDLEESLRVDNKVSELIGGAGMQLRVAVQHDKLKENSDAEVHDASDDVYYVLEGTAVLNLGGKLENPREISTGEWRAPKIVGGQTFVIKKGDLIIVPRGTPHQRNTIKGKTFSMILIKIYAEPMAAPKK